MLLGVRYRPRPQQTGATGHQQPPQSTLRIIMNYIGILPGYWKKFSFALLLLDIFRTSLAQEFKSILEPLEVQKLVDSVSAPQMCTTSIKGRQLGPATTEALLDTDSTLSGICCSSKDLKRKLMAHHPFHKNTNGLLLKIQLFFGPCKVLQFGNNPKVSCSAKCII